MVVKSKSEIVEILTSKLQGVYCDTCDPSDTDWEWDEEQGKEVAVLNARSNCEECYRKKMGWALSKNTAEQLAEEILK